MASGIGMNFKMTASVSQFAAKMEKVEQSLREVTSSSKNSAKSLKLLSTIEVGKLLVGGLGKMKSMLTSAASSMKAFADQNRLLVDRLGKVSDATGFGVESLQVLTRVSLDAGIQSEAFNGALERMGKRVAEAGMGVGEALPALKGLGINIQALRSMNPEQQFMVIAKALEGIKSPAERSAQAFRIFSDQGIKMAPMFQDMEKKVARVAGELKELGVVLSGDQVDAVEAMNDSLSRTKQVVQAVGQQILANFAPGVELANEALMKFIKNFQFGTDSGGKALAQYISNAFMNGAIALGDFVDYMSDVFATAYNSLSKLFKALYNFMSNTLGVEFNESISPEGQAAENRLRDIDRLLAGMENSVKKHQSNIDNGLDTFGINASKMAKVTDEIHALEIQRKAVAADMERQEKAYLAKTKENVFGQASLGDAMRGLKEKMNESASTAGTGIEQMSTATASYEEAVKKVGSAATTTEEAKKTLAKTTGSLGTAFEGMKEKLGGVADSAKSIMGSVQEQIVNSVSSIAKNMNESQQQQKDAALSSWQSAADGIMSQFEGMNLGSRMESQLKSRMEYEKYQYEKYVEAVQSKRMEIQTRIEERNKRQLHSQEVRQKAFETAREARELAKHGTIKDSILSVFGDGTLGSKVSEGMSNLAGESFTSLANDLYDSFSTAIQEANPTGGAGVEEELTTQTSILEQVRDAVQTKNDPNTVVTTIM